MNWIVPATVVRVMDGDTVVVRADLGWRVQLETSVRIDGINAPEMSTPEGVKAHHFASMLIRPKDKVMIISKRLLGATEKYGRTLADLTYGYPPASFAEAMVKAGHAKPWDGMGEPP